MFSKCDFRTLNINFVIMQFTERDIQQLQQKGIRSLEIERQLDLLYHGSQYPKLVKPARLDEGIIPFTKETNDFYQTIFKNSASQFSIVRFIPASGAASRMFAHLIDYIHENKESEFTAAFFTNVEKFPFYDLLPAEVKKDTRKLAIYLLDEKGLRFQHLPKGLIPFHKNGKEVITAFESHLTESSKYLESEPAKIKNHFTVSEEAVQDFRMVLNNWRKNQNISDTYPEVDFSFQEKLTDTVSINEKGEIVREENGEIIFRPGGHGSLLKNLQSLNEDIIFIRNIDNVLAPSANENYVSIHQRMAGMLVHNLEFVYSLQRKLVSNNLPDDQEWERLVHDFHYTGKREINLLHDFVFRPLRICGMVKNEGEPGGGPFWVEEKNGSVSLQIIEGSQVNPNDHHQGEIFRSGTHFNPVDICCCIKNYKGEKFDLNRFRNEEYSFLATKKYQGKNITILEHPGLWNGSMHHWLTLFVEIPIDVFNPVKTVNDLLRENHQK